MCSLNINSENVAFLLCDGGTLIYVPAPRCRYTRPVGTLIYVPKVSTSIDDEFAKILNVGPLEVMTGRLTAFARIRISSMCMH